MRKHKKYRIRTYSPAWWAVRVGAATAPVLGLYAMTLLLVSMPV